MFQPHASPLAERELILERVIDVSPEKLFRAWTEPELLVQWFCPKPWGVSSARLDVRAGGSSLVVMRNPEGEEFPNRGVYLEVVPNRKLVFTDAFVEAWIPSEKPFFVGTITFEPAETGTRYRAGLLHWSVADREEHERMGFHDGWAKATDQLEALARTL